MHHSLRSHLLLALLDLALYLGVAFHLLEFLFDLLLGHLELFLKLPPLEEKIRSRHEHQHYAYQHYQVEDRHQSVGHARSDARIYQHDELRKPVPYLVVNHHADDNYLDKPL